MNNGEELEKPAGRQTSRLKKVIIALVVLAAVYLLGYLPSYWSARTAEKRWAQLEQQSSLVRLHGQLGMASFEANRNNYHNAAEYSNLFFNGLKTTIDKTSDAALKEKLQAVSASGDQITEYLAKADPAAKEKLAQMYADFYYLIR